MVERKRRNIAFKAFLWGLFGARNQANFQKTRDLTALAWGIIFSLGIPSPTRTDGNAHGIFIEVSNTGGRDNLGGSES